MKIAIINNLYPPYDRGGAEQVLRAIVDELKKEHEIILITARPFKGKRSLNPIPSIENGLKIYRFFPLNLYFYANDYKHNAFCRLFWHLIDMFNFSAAGRVKQILENERPDLVMTHNLKGISLQIPKVISELRLKHIHTLHDVQLAVPSGLLIKGKEKSFIADGFLTRWYAKVCRKLFVSPDIVVSPSKFLMEYYTYKGFFPKSEHKILPNPLLKLPEPQDKARKGQRDIVFLYLGQIEKHKGANFLLKAFSYIEEPNYKLIIAGKGKELKKIEMKSQLDDRIKVLGFVPREKLPSLFASVDYTIVPSLCYENSPMVIYESLYYGVPVIASRLGGIQELVKDYDNGMTFKANNMNSLKEAIGKIVELKRSDLSQKARQTVAGFNVENYVKLLLGFLVNQESEKQS